MLGIYLLGIIYVPDIYYAGNRVRKCLGGTFVLGVTNHALGTDLLGMMYAWGRAIYLLGAHYVLGKYAVVGTNMKPKLICFIINFLF